MSTGLFKNNVTDKLFAHKLYMWACEYEENLAVNNPKELICYKKNSWLVEGCKIH